MKRATAALLDRLIMVGLWALALALLVLGAACGWWGLLAAAGLHP